MRMALHSFLVALIVSALFWGNCLSCPQMLLSRAAPSHGCCKHKRAPGCNTQDLRHFVKTDSASPVSPQPAALAKAAPPASAVLALTAFVPLPEVFAPPDLHPVIRI